MQRAVAAGDLILCLKVDRLGRTMVETMETILALVQRGVVVETSDMGRLDPGSASGEMAINVMLAFAQFERRRLIERTNEGLAHARASGKKLGRPSKVTPNLASAICAAYESNLNISQIARMHGLSRDVVRRVIRESQKTVSPDCDSQTPGGSTPSRVDVLRE